MYSKVGKPILDFIIAFLILVVLVPLLLIVAFLIKIDSKGSVFFTQERVGKDEKTFKIYKLRTMKEFGLGQLSDKERITKIGGFLRRFSIDEFPQLINVLIGDMSLIGPRPFYKSYLPYYTKVERIRHSVKPGITGYAQVNGRSRLTYDEQFELDVVYVQKLSFITDFKIFFRTIPLVLGAKNVMIDRRVDNGSLVEVRKNRKFNL
jgi:lipopolysaccharide/colanic/teichoic acid biosynthesis glycosyltransferase